MSDAEALPRDASLIEDEDVEGAGIDFSRPHIPFADMERDRWEPRGNWLVRVHVDPRLDLFAPHSDQSAIDDCPINPVLLSGVARQTSMTYGDGRQEEIIDNNWDVPEGSQLRSKLVDW
jgi:hypothetical protein